VQEGIIHLLRRAAELRDEKPHSGWDWIVQAPAFASLLPLIYYTIPHAALSLSEAARERCAQAYYRTVARNTLLYQELASILEALSDAEIPVVVLKGAALALTLYPSIGVRPMGDVDILVPRARLPEALACLKGLGYAETTPEMVPGFNRAMGHHVGLDGGRDIPLHVEVHWTLAAGEHDQHAPSMAWFWDQTEEWKLEGGGWKGESILRSPSSVFQLTPTAHLLYLAAHLMLQHGGAQAQLIWFYDIDLMVRREAGRLDWGELLRRAKEFRWAAALHAALQGAQDRFGTPLPRGFLDALAEESDHRDVRLVGWKAAPLQTRALRVQSVMSALDWRGRLRLAWALFFPTPSYMRWRYLSCLRAPLPSLLWPLTYLYRWLDILREGLSTALKLALRNGRARWRGIPDEAVK